MEKKDIIKKYNEFLDEILKIDDYFPNINDIIICGIALNYSIISSKSAYTNFKKKYDDILRENGDRNSIRQLFEEYVLKHYNKMDMIIKEKINKLKTEIYNSDRYMKRGIIKNDELIIKIKKDFFIDEKHGEEEVRGVEIEHVKKDRGLNIILAFFGIGLVIVSVLSIIGIIFAWIWVIGYLVAFIMFYKSKSMNRIYAESKTIWFFSIVFYSFSSWIYVLSKIL